MNSLVQDLRYGLRLLLKRPGFTTVVVLSLALGIGANAAIFSIVNALLFRSLLYPQAERMVFVWSSSQADSKLEGPLSPHNFTDLRNRTQSFDSYFAYSNTSFTLTGDNLPEALPGVLCSGDFASVVATAPAAGRMFSAEDDQPGKEHVAVISDGLWKRRFGASGQIIGQSVQLNDESYTIIGVMPPEFSFPSRAVDVWAPLALDLSKYQRGTSFLSSAGRLKAGITVEQAQADLLNITEQLRNEVPNFGTLTLKVESIREHFFGDLRRPLMVLFGAVALVLLIACVNVANLGLSRATSRWKEIALRRALGASGWRLVRLLLTESVLLALIGGAAGLLLASYAVDLLTAINPAAFPTTERITIDGYVIAFTFVMSLTTGLVCGVIPAWQAAKADLSRSLRENSRAATGAKHLKLIRSGLVVAEISLSLVLLVGAGLLIESLWKLMQVDPGFRPENVIMCRVDLPRAKYPQEWQQSRFFQSALEQVRAIPGVQSTAFATSLPFSGSRSASSFSIDEHPVSRNDLNAPAADRHQVAPGYFAAIGIPLLAGRDFSDADDISHPGVIVINEAAARHFWPDEDPIGKHLTIGMPQEVKLYGKPVSREIVGVIGNVKHEDLKDSFQPEMYIPAWQLPPVGMMLIVRGRAPAEKLIGSIRGAVQSIDPNQPIRRVQLLSAAIENSVAPQRFATTLLLLFACLALVLATIGIYGVMSYSVAQRTQEIGIRLALGAQPSDVLKLIVSQGLILALIGVALGVGAAFAVTRVMSSLLYGVSATDPVIFAAIAAALTGVALGACFVPARRAMRVDPIVTLRYE